MTRYRTGAVAVLEALEAHGVNTIFGVPGEETTALMTAIEDSALTFVLCRHEQAAAFMASVHGRLTNTPAVCLSTLGPGATNLVTGVADAQLDHVPLIALTGQAGRDRLKRESHQVIDLEALFAPVTKQSRTLLMADDIPSSVAEAVRLAKHEKPGAVHLSLPEGVAATQTNAPIVQARYTRPGAAHTDSLRDVAKAIGAAERPIVVAGAGVLRDKAVDAVTAFVENTQIPLVTTFMAKGILAKDHPQMLFSVGQPQDDIIDRALQAADLIVAIGFDPVEYDTTKLTLGKTPVAAISLAPSPVDSGWHITAEAVGELSHTLSSVTAHLNEARWPTCPTFASVRDDMIQHLSRPNGSDRNGLMSPHDLCASVSDVIRPEDTVISGVGLHKLWVARQVIAKRAGQVIVPNGLAGMGLALPGAIAAARVQTKGRVLAICGDGEVMMNLQEMETAARLGLRLTIMVWEDGGYGLIDEHQDDDRPEFSFNNPVWSKLAHSFGWTHAHAKTAHDAYQLLHAGLTAEGPTLVSVRVDYALGGGLPTAENAA
ncbi:acetolactate synthase large subunit [Marivita sp. S0852]|uniref:acetolactate synthase large subunit n=1 Tax=Marivita sp. S0852 TaxID=3373893 RepID=UPI003982A013